MAVSVSVGFLHGLPVHHQHLKIHKIKGKEERKRHCLWNTNTTVNRLAWHAHPHPLVFFPIRYFFKKINKRNDMSISNISSMTQVQFQSGHKSHITAVCLSRAQQADTVTSGHCRPPHPAFDCSPLGPPSTRPPFILQMSENSDFSIFIVVQVVRAGQKIPINQAVSTGVLLLLPSEEGPCTLQVVLVPRT